MNNFKILLEEFLYEELSSKSYDYFDEAVKDAIADAREFVAFDRKFLNMTRGLEQKLKEPNKGKWTDTTIHFSLDLKTPEYKFLDWFFSKIDIELEIVIYSNEVTGKYRYEINPNLLARDNNKINSFRKR